MPVFKLILYTILVKITRMSNKFNQTELANRLLATNISTQEEKIDVVDDFESEVECILDHRVNEYGPWQYLIKFKDGEIDWISDDKCYCEQTISNYLSTLPNIKTVYILCRISKKADPNSISLSAQANQMVESVYSVIDANVRVKVIQVVGSAFTRIPTTFSEVGLAARSGDSILFFRVDRLSRNIVESLSWLEDLNERGVTLASFTENISYSMNKTQFIESVLNAQKESEMIGRRVRMGLSARRARGDTVFGACPYGEKSVRINGRVVSTTNEEELEVVRRLLVRNHPTSLAGMTSQLVANTLNDAGIRKRGRKWSGQMVSSLRHKFRDSPVIKIEADARSIASYLAASAASSS